MTSRVDGMFFILFIYYTSVSFLSPLNASMADGSSSSNSRGSTRDTSRAAGIYFIFSIYYTNVSLNDTKGVCIQINIEPIVRNSS